MATGQQGFDPDDFVRDDSFRQRERAEQRRLDELRPRTQQQREDRQPDRAKKTSSPSSVDRLAEVVNDPDIVLDSKMMKTINDPSMVMMSNGQVARLQSQFSQFQARNLVPRKKRKKNPKLAKAMKEANSKLRLKSGKLRKGKTQGDVARLAQRLLKRMK